MPIIDVVNQLEDRKHAKEVGVRTDYARLEIDLGNAAFVGTNIEIAVSGSYLAKISYSGNATVYFSIDNRHAAKIYADEFKLVRREYERLWLTNPAAQSGKKLILQIGQINYAEIEPDDWGEKIHLYLTAIYGKTNAVQGTDRLAVAGDAATDTIAAPGAGSRIVVLGYQIYETVDAPFCLLHQSKLKFETSGLQLWEGVTDDPGAVCQFQSIISGIWVEGALNEALTLTNADVTAGSSTAVAIVFYRIEKP